MINQLKIALNLISRDLLILKKDFWGNLIDILVWPTVAAIVFGYIIPSINNMHTQYGAFVLMGAIITIATVTAFDGATQLINDLETKRTIDYYLTLPLSPSLLFIKQACSISIKNIIFTLPIFPWGKFVLYDRFDITHFSLIKFILIYMMINIFLGFFALWLTAWVKNQAAFIHVWLRMYNPMIWFGGQIFSWEQLNNVFPTIGYLMLLNPMIYCTEGLRAAIFGPVGFLNFWLSFCMLTLFTLLFAFLAITGLKKRLDCI